jgi:hypothetical protein
MQYIGVIEIDGIDWFCGKQVCITDNDNSLIIESGSSQTKCAFAIICNTIFAYLKKNETRSMEIQINCDNERRYIYSVKCTINGVFANIKTNCLNEDDIVDVYKDKFYNVTQTKIVLDKQ